MKLEKISKQQAHNLMGSGVAGYMKYVNNKASISEMEKEYIVVDFDLYESTFLFRNKSEFWEENEGRVKFLPITELVENMELFEEVV